MLPFFAFCCLVGRSMNTDHEWIRADVSRNGSGPAIRAGTDTLSECLACGPCQLLVGFVMMSFSVTRRIATRVGRTGGLNAQGLICRIAKPFGGVLARLIPRSRRSAG